MDTVTRILSAREALEMELDRGALCDHVGPAAVRRLTRVARLAHAGRIADIDALAEICVARALVVLAQPLPSAEILPTGLALPDRRRGGLGR